MGRTSMLARGSCVLLLTLSLLDLATRARAQDEAAGDAAAPEEAVAEAAPEEEEAAPDTVLQEAMQRYDDAVAVFDRGDYGAALAEFERIYELLDGHPNQYFVLYNIGRCYEQMFRYDQAMEAYRRYLEQGGDDADDRAEVEVTIRTLENLLGAIRIEVNVERAEVWLSDRMIGEAPGVIRLPAGQHVIEVRADGYTSVRREIVLAARQLVDQSFELSGISDFRGIDPGFFYTGVGLSLAALGVGAGFGIAALSERGSANAQIAAGERFDVMARGAQIRELATLADVFYGVGAGFVVTTIILAVVTDWSGGAPSSGSSGSAGLRLELAPVVGPTTSGLTIVGSF